MGIEKTTSTHQWSRQVQSLDKWLEMLWRWGCISEPFEGHIQGALLAARVSTIAILHGSVMGCSHAPLKPHVTNGWACTQASERPDGIKGHGFLSLFRQWVSVLPSWTQSPLEGNVSSSFHQNMAAASVLGFCYGTELCRFSTRNSWLVMGAKHPPLECQQPSPPPWWARALLPGMRV